MRCSHAAEILANVLVVFALRLCKPARHYRVMAGAEVLSLSPALFFSFCMQKLWREEMVYGHETIPLAINPLTKQEKYSDEILKFI